MELLLPVCYALILILQIVLLVRAVKLPAPRRWGILLGLEGASVAAAAGLAVIFEKLPGSGTMPGLTWFAEWGYSIGAALVYAVMLVLSLILYFLRKR